MKKVAIVAPYLRGADAVGNDVAFQHQWLSAAGCEVRVFADAWDTSFRDLPVESYHGVRDWVRRPDDLVLYHFSMGWGWATDELARLTCRRVIRDHNVTPSAFFEDQSPDHVTACAAGEDERARLARIGADLYLSDSQFNRDAFIAAGAPAERCRVVPPFHQTDRLLGQESSYHLLTACRDGSANLLSVGRIAPNKNHRLLLEAFAVYHHDYNPRSRLLIVGYEDRRLLHYIEGLHALAHARRIEDAVVWLASATEAELKTCYLVADALVMTSQHEGFCVPLIEAMALRTPIIGLAAGAVPGTAGEAGLIWDEPDPEIFAASIDAVVRDRRVKEALTARGARRYRACFTNDRVGEQLTACLGNYL